MRNLIVIHEEHCTGCGACAAVCPEGAIYLVEDKANVDQSLCRECEACVAACPTGAITIAVPEQPYVGETTWVPVPRTEPEVIHVRSSSEPVPFRVKVLPIVSTALGWAGREIAPRLVDYLVHSLDRRQAAARPTNPVPRGLDRGLGGRGGGGGRRRRRRRGR